jgi:hypothetical protein
MGLMVTASNKVEREVMRIVFSRFLSAGFLLTASGSMALSQPLPSGFVSPYAPNVPVVAQGTQVPAARGPLPSGAEPTREEEAAEPLPPPTLKPVVPLTSSHPREAVVSPPHPVPPTPVHHAPMTTCASPPCPGADRHWPYAAARVRGGIEHLQDTCLGYLEEFEEPPLGATMGRHFQIQVNNALAARMTLYDYDFLCGQDRLNVRGKSRVREMGLLMARSPFPLVIAHVPGAPALAEARRLAVLNELALAHLPVPPERIIIAPPIAHPLSGVEADLLYLNLLQQTQDRGEVPTASEFVGGGFTPGGGGGQ